MRLPVTLIMILLLSLTAFAQGGPDQPATATPIGTYLRGTFERLYDADEAVITLQTGEIVNATIFDDAGRYTPGQAVVVWKSGGNHLLDAPVRYPQLLVQLAVFVLLAALIGRTKGLRAVLGTVLSLGVMLHVVAPRLAGGQDVITTMLLAVLGILVFTLYLVHGVNRKTTAALLGTLASAAIGYGLVVYFTHAMHLTGVNSAGGYAAQSLLGLNALDLYLVSVVLAAVGALNDVTVTQASLVETLAEENPALRGRELYARAMRVGLDHIGSMVNVLVLVYAASALPNMLMFVRDPNPLWQKLNGEGFASEITAVLVGATCLLLAVPLTTALAALLLRRGVHARRNTIEASAAD